MSDKPRNAEECAQMLMEARAEIIGLKVENRRLQSVCSSNSDDAAMHRMKNDVLIEALKPFAGIAQFVERMRPETGIYVHANNRAGNYVVTVADCNKARDAIAAYLCADQSAAPIVRDQDPSP